MSGICGGVYLDLTGDEDPTSEGGDTIHEVEQRISREADRNGLFRMVAESLQEERNIGDQTLVIVVTLEMEAKQLVEQ
ncbi:hypothetical protein Tco_0116190 [Tanacetum coccineum]